MQMILFMSIGTGWLEMPRRLIFPPLRMTEIICWSPAPLPLISREYVCIPESNVIIIDESLPEDVVAFFDAFGNAAHTALMWDLVGEDVLITGAGPIGIIAARDARPQSGHLAHVLMANDHGGPDMLLGPGVPIVDIARRASASTPEPGGW